MNTLNCCPYCKSGKRSVIGVQLHQDRYLDLIDSSLNNVKRTWLSCENCNFIYRSPIISESEANLMYKKYRSFEFRKISASDYYYKLTSFPESESECFDRVNYIKEKIGGLEKILDVGCGSGVMLYWLKRKYPNSFFLGLDQNSDFTNIVKQKLDINIIEDIYREDSIKEDFDLTVCADVIEHIHDPHAIWLALTSNIHKDKYLFIEVPSHKNFDFLSIEHTVFDAPHLYFYRKEHIFELAETHGFTIISNKSVYTKNKKHSDYRSILKDRYILQKC